MFSKLAKGYVPVPAEIPSDVAAELAKLGDLLDVVNKIKNLGTTVLEGLLKGQGSSNYKLVAYILFAKAFKTFQSAQLLCLCGYGSDALSLCASLFENVIDLLYYMGKTPVLRPLRYMQYEQVAKYEQTEKMLRKKRLPHGRRKAYRNIRHTLAPQTAKLLKYFPNRQGWSQKSLYGRAKALGVAAEVDYNEHYWIYCGHKHRLPMAVSGWTIELTGGNSDVTQGPDAKEVFHGVRESAGRFLQLCLIVDDPFALSLQSRIETLSISLETVAESVAKKYPELLK